MAQHLKILLVEDNSDDAEIIQRVLKKEKKYTFKVVETRPAFENALDKYNPDIILSDNALPEFSATEALEIVQQRSLDVPFILVTGTVSEEFAAGIIKKGADDYLLKDRLGRLPLAIELALKQKRSENEKRKAKELNIFKAELLNAIGQAAIATDLNGIVKYWNKAAEEMYGWSANEAIGRNVMELTPVQEIKNQAIEIMEQLRKGKKWSGEFVVQHKDGRFFPALVTDTPWYNDDHELIGIIGISTDISERKHGEELVRYNERRLNIIYNTVCDVIYMISIEGPNSFRFVSVNKRFEELTGLKRSDVENKYVEEVIPAPSSELVIQNYKEALLHKKTVTWEETTPYPTGLKTGIVTISPVLDENEECTLLVGSVHDITDRKIAEEEIKESNLRYSYVSKATSDGVWDWNLATNNIHLGEGFQTIYGYDQSELNAKADFGNYIFTRTTGIELRINYWSLLKEIQLGGQKSLGLRKKMGPTLM